MEQDMVTLGLGSLLVCEEVQERIAVYCILVAASAAAPASLQSCPTLCDPIDGLPPGSSVPGILQAKALIKPSHYCLRKFQSGAGFCSTEQSAFRSTDPFISTPTPLMLPSSTAMDAPNINGLVLYQHLWRIRDPFILWSGFLPVDLCFLLFLYPRNSNDQFSEPGLHIVSNR